MKTAVLVFPGSNCDHDCYHAVRHVLGREAQFVWHQDASLAGFDLVIVPGGFSYGDYLRPGAIAKFSPVMGALAKFAASGGLVLGICNGFQILTEAGLLPGALMLNSGMKFICRDTYLRVETSNSFVTGRMEKGKVISVPIAHMEGCYIADDDTIKQIEDDDRILLRYCGPDGGTGAESNPNGSIGSIAGVLSERRNVAGMMPHPERVVETALGGVDGLLVFESILNSLSAA
jgi:phosphoribosylformylglycinamidine synthase